METFFEIILIIAALFISGIVIFPTFFGAPWHPTSKKKIREILEFCQPIKGQTIIDLGSGDGRVVIMAAKEYSLHGIGLEIDPFKVWFAKLKARWEGVDDRVTILRKNIFEYNYGEADILFIYLTHQAIDKLFPKILNQLKPEVKIICYRFCLKGLQPQKVNQQKNIFLYSLNKGNKLSHYS